MLPAAGTSAAADGPIIPIGDIIGLGILAGAAIYDMCKDDESERCKKVKQQCIEGCSDFVLQKPRSRRKDLGGMDFHTCVRRCMDDNGC